MVDDDSALLARLEALRRLAFAIDLGLLDHGARGAGDDTWLGPTAVAFRDDLARVRALTASAESDVRATIARLEAVIEQHRQERIRAGVRS